MAMICVSGARECDGCQRCIKEPEELGICSVCGEPITTDCDRYQFEGDEMIHDDCLLDWARKYFREAGT